MELSLRKASEDDLQTILDILNAGTRNKIRRGDLAWGMTDHDPGMIRGMVTQGLFYLAFNGSAPVGTLALAWQDVHMWGTQPADAGYVQRFAVAPGYSGQDMGGHILDLAFQEVTKNNRQCLRIAVPSGNMKLRAYYEKHGFTRADYRVVSPVHPAYPAAYYERRSEAGPAQADRTSKPLFKRIFRK